MSLTNESYGYSLWIALVAIALASSPGVVLAQGNPPPDLPSVTVRGKVYTPRSILARNMGTEEDQTSAFTPHKVIGNIYYVGTRTLSSYLITTPQGHILINSTYERNVRTIEKSVTQLGFKFADVKILLATHAHGDHQEGDALVKELTGAQVMAMQEDIADLTNIKPGGKAHPIDRTLHDGETVTLGGTSLVAHLTPGHTHGCTTWTMAVPDGGKTLNVVFACSYRAPGRVTPAVEAEFNRTFKMVRTLPCDVPLGDHPAQYDMVAKYAKVKAGAPNPFIDPANCWLEADIQEAMFRAQIELQQKGARAAPAPALPVASDQDVIVARERDWNEAFYHKDVTFIEKLLADEFTATYEDGSRGNKAKELALTEEFNQQVESAIQDDFTVKVYGDTAVVWFTLRLVGIKQGQRAELALSYTDVWVMRDGRWQCVSVQSTRLTAK